ncbi:MAG: Tim44 domain-containing protein [Lachnospiraceae bacterium]|nr:Tim44 domain-containing protein [Lachnospiraceae bacterium]
MREFIKKHRKWMILLMALFLLSLLFQAAMPVPVRADFGNFAGDSDFGGGGGGGDWDFDSDGGGGIGTTLIAIALVIVILIVCFIWEGIKKLTGKGKKEVPSRSAPPGVAGSSRPALQMLSAYTALDPGFNEAQFRERLANLYVQMQQRWHERNIDSLKPYFTDFFYNQSNMQLQELIRNAQIPCTERVAVLDVSPQGFYQNSGIDHVVVIIRSRIVAYIINERTGQVISGSKTKEKFMTYEWDLCRKSGVITGRTDALQSVTCPHCGAPININQSAKCPFCESVVTVTNQDWALNNIKGISQHTR